MQRLKLARRRDRAGLGLRVEDWAAADHLLDDLEAAFEPLEALRRTGGTHALQVLAEAHLNVAEALAALPAEREAEAESSGSSGASELWRDEAGHAAAELFAQLLEPNLVAPAMSVSAYPDFYRALIAGETVRSMIPVHPRLSIWGPYEARLQRPDVVILGSLNEGTWPEAADPGPWLNRPMRRRLGLPLPEERIGDAAHDVTQLLGADEVYLTRSEKVDGNPSVPSRWLLRLETVLGAVGAADALSPERPWLAWARQRDAVPLTAPAKPPKPAPPLELRPRKLSVSSVETWIANPYAIYAQRILKLDPLPALGAEPDASLRGQHRARGAGPLRRAPSAITAGRSRSGNCSRLHAAFSRPIARIRALPPSGSNASAVSPAGSASRSRACVKTRSSHAPKLMAITYLQRRPGRSVLPHAPTGSMSRGRVNSLSRTTRPVHRCRRSLPGRGAPRRRSCCSRPRLRWPAVSRGSLRAT